MTLTVIKDIESFFSGVESSLVGKLSGATADVVKKTVALAHVAEQLAESFAANTEATWSSFDNTPTPTIVANIIEKLNAGSFEDAALGVVYLVYQGTVEATSKLNTTLVADVPVVGTIETGVEKVWTEVKTDVEAVVHKVEDLFTSTPTNAPTPTVLQAVAAPTTTPVAAPAPEVAAAVVPPQQPVPASSPVAMVPNLAS